jgi:hypothetical protein
MVRLSVMTAAAVLVIMAAGDGTAHPAVKVRLENIFYAAANAGRDFNPKTFKHLHCFRSHAAGYHNIGFL